MEVIVVGRTADLKIAERVAAARSRVSRKVAGILQPYRLDSGMTT
jgi:hypothetical protein